MMACRMSGACQGDGVDGIVVWRKATWESAYACQGDGVDGIGVWRKATWESAYVPAARTWQRRCRLPPQGRDDDCSIVYAPWYMVAFLKPDTMPSSFAVPPP